MSLLPRRHDQSASEILKARGINRLVYFHSDHFEPWRYIPGRPADFALAADDLEHYVAITRDRDFARRATLFFKPNVNNVVDSDRLIYRADPHDPIGFVPLPKRQEEIQAVMFATLEADDRPLELHIHHENITWNDRMRDQAMARQLADPENRRWDEARFELLLHLNLDVMDGHGGFDRDRWFFVHGHWALNGSDPHECTIVREIEMLRRNGCLGDFTQPSGRPHTNSRAEEPYLVNPVPLTKGYDRPEANPIAAAGAARVTADRFFVWASKINHRFTSIDHYSRFVQDRMTDPTIFARHNAHDGFAHDGVLYVKTHAHTMHPAYWQEGSAPLPHAHPAIIAELGTLFDAADKANIVIEFSTVREVFDRLMAAPAPPQRDLISLYRLREGHAMDELGCDIAFRSGGGAATLPVLASMLPQPHHLMVATPAPVPPDAVWATIIDLPQPVPREPVLAPLNLVVAADLAAVVTEIAGVAGRVRGDSPGVTTLPDLSAQAQLASALEAAGLDAETPLVEIGCGDGLLATVLSARGWTVTGIDADIDQIAMARTIADAADARGLLSKRPYFEVGQFPGWVPRQWSADHVIAIVSSPVNSDGRSGQAAFVRALTSFGGALVDLNRFYVVRSTEPERTRLIELFGRAGFRPPQLIEGAADTHLALFRRSRKGSGLFDWTGKVLQGLGLSKTALGRSSPHQ